MIVVMPNGNPSKQAAPGETTENFNYHPVMSHLLPNFGEGSYEIAFDEIVKYIDTHYRTKALKSQRAIAGLSMGGLHSMLISANHPDLFDYIGLFSPATPKLWYMDTTRTAYKNLNAKLIVQKQKGYRLYWISIGKTDFLYQPVQEYLKTLDENEFPYTYSESQRGHIWNNWRAYMLQFTPLLFRK